MFVTAALLVDDPLYRVYFRRRRNTLSANSLEEDEYSLIIGARIVPSVGSGQQPAQVYKNI